MSAFSEYVTSSAFNLSLSKRQIESLCMMEQYGFAWSGAHTFNSLIGKGLCERLEGEEGSDCPRVRITDAGMAVIPLLKLAGLYVEMPKLEPAVSIPPIVIKPKTQEPA
ncbi:hypothetical protein [Cupriavidus sp. D384]|uniref:hypothetical protein n=1 Tax=Cupriavidus sp. D384 TaxID=1538095 RepID=UPI000834443B|nr:hypothetical protein [Cupriavidus sp. D384]